MGLKSMTAFGSAKVATSSCVFLIELHSINRKALEFSIYLPKEFLSFDILFRKILQEKIKRGQVSLRITKEYQMESLKSLLPEKKIFKEFQKSWQELSSELGYSEDQVDLRFITEQYFRSPIVDLTFRGEEYKEHLEKGLDEALKALMAMKEKEGTFLQRDILSRIDTIASFVNEVEKKSVDLPALYREKLQKKIKELTSYSDDEMQSLDKEVILYAERCDISEEITRLKSHIEQFGAFTRKNEPVGRSLDFLMQEMLREANTMASKSVDVEVSHLVLNIKYEIEKIREQVQNIE